MVMIIRHRQAEQCLQQAVNVSRLEEVGAARHQGHALRGVIDHHGEVVAGAEILAGEDHIALRARVAELLPPATIMPAERPLGCLGGVGGARQIERSEARRVGKECGSSCGSRWSQYHSQKKSMQTTLKVLCINIVLTRLE